MPLTKQEIFDKVCTAMKAQNCRSVSDMGCAYRGMHGNRCAIGHLIPDELYHEQMEGKNVFTLFNMYHDPNNKEYLATDAKLRKDILPKLIDILGEENERLLKVLQKLHDINTKSDNFWPSFNHNAHRIASEYDLDTSVLDPTF